MRRDLKLFKGGEREREREERERERYAHQTSSKQIYVHALIIT